MGDTQETNNVKSMRRFWGGLRGPGKSQESVGTDTTTSATSTPVGEDSCIPLIERIKMDMAASSSSLGKRSTNSNNRASNEGVDELISEQSSISWMNEESHSVLSLVGSRSFSSAPKAQSFSSRTDTNDEKDVITPRVTNTSSLKKKLIKVKRTPGSGCSADGSVDVSVLSAMKSAGKTKFTARELKEMGVDIPAQRGRTTTKSKSRVTDENVVRRSRSRSRVREGKNGDKSRGRDGSERDRSTETDASRKARSRSIGRARSRSRVRPRSDSNHEQEEDVTQVYPIEIRPKSPSKEILSVKERVRSFEGQAAKEKPTSMDSTTRQRPEAALHDSASRGREATEKSTQRSRSVHRRTIEQDDRDNSSPEKSSRGRGATERSTQRSRSVHRRSIEQDDRDSQLPVQISRGRDATEKSTQRSRSVHRRRNESDDRDSESPEKLPWERDPTEKSTRRSKSVHRRSIGQDDPESSSKGKDGDEKRRSRSVHRRTIEQDDRDSSSPEKTSRGRDATEKSTQRSRSVHRRSIEKDDPAFSRGKDGDEKLRSRSVHRRTIEQDDRDSESPEKASRGRDATEKPSLRSKSVRRRSIDVNEPGESPEKSSRGRDATDKSPRRSKSVHRRSIGQSDREADLPVKASRGRDTTEKSPRRSKSAHRRSIGQGEAYTETTRRKSLASEKSPRQKSVGTEEGSLPRRSVESPEKSRRSKSVARKVLPKLKPQEYNDESYSDESILPPVPTQILIRPDQDVEIYEEKESPPQISVNNDEIYDKIKHAGITQEQFLALTLAGLTITNEGY